MKYLKSIYQSVCVNTYLFMRAYKQTLLVVSILCLPLFAVTAHAVEGGIGSIVTNVSTEGKTVFSGGKIIVVIFGFFITAAGVLKFLSLKRTNESFTTPLVMVVIGGACMLIPFLMTSTATSISGGKEVFDIKTLEN